MSGPVALRYEGLRELAVAFKATDDALLGELKDDLGKVGDVVRDEARTLFDSISVKTANGFETRVRAGGVARELVVVAQSLRKTTGLHGLYGAMQMKVALLPARDAKLGEAAVILDQGAGRLLREHGF